MFVVLLIASNVPTLHSHIKISSESSWFFPSLECNGNTRMSSCPIYMPQGKTEDLTGRKFNRLTVISWHGIKHHERTWLCKCDCGNEAIVCSNHLNKGKVKSCGCANIDQVTRMGRANTKHGHWNDGKFTPEYNSWLSMNARCNNVSMHAYSDYGGRGIKICDRWSGDNGFVNFYADMGNKPTPKHTLDRINNNGNYEPSNCRWGTAKQQSRNRRSNHIIEYNGESFCIGEWREIFGLKSSTFYGMLQKSDFKIEPNIERIKKLSKTDYFQKTSASIPQ